MTWNKELSGDDQSLRQKDFLVGALRRIKDGDNCHQVTWYNAISGTG